MGHDADLQVAVGPPPERAKQAVPAPVGKESILQAAHLLSLGFVAVPFLMILPKRFGVGEIHLGPPSAAGSQLWIGSGEVRLTEKQRGMRVSRYGDGRRAFEKLRTCFDSAR